MMIHHNGGISPENTVETVQYCICMYKRLLQTLGPY